MIKLKNIFKNTLSEQAAKSTSDIEILADPAKASEVEKNAEKVANALGKVKSAMGMQNESELEEAELVNHMYDYRGGVEYVLRDPSQAEEVSQSIRNWTERKGFTIIKHKLSRSGRVGYFHFRLGPDPERDAQRIQGYFSSKIEISKFRFNVREKRQAPAPKAPRAPQPEI